MGLRQEKENVSAIDPKLVAYAAIAFAAILVFVLGWMLGSSGTQPIGSTIDYPTAEQPKSRYAIHVEIDSSFYSFYDEFAQERGENSVAGLQ